MLPSAAMRSLSPVVPAEAVSNVMCPLSLFVVSSPVIALISATLVLFHLNCCVWIAAPALDLLTFVLLLKYPVVVPSPYSISFTAELPLITNLPPVPILTSPLDVIVPVVGSTSPVAVTIPDTERVPMVETPATNACPSGLSVIPEPTRIFDLAVIIPTESTLVTSS